MFLSDSYHLIKMIYKQKKSFFFITKKTKNNLKTIQKMTTKIFFNNTCVLHQEPFTTLENLKDFIQKSF